MRKIALLTLSLTAALGALISASETPAQDEIASPGRLAVDFSKIIGPIKAVNGTNIGYPTGYETLSHPEGAFADARFAAVRLHDCPWYNGGLRVVDVQHIFGNFNSDPADPKNYFFAATDDYIRPILEGGSKIIYRLGTSIEHSRNHYFTGPPEDPEKYAEICAGIVRHYTRGWANGFHWKIDYWEIWNEPDVVPQMWRDKDFQTYCDFYVLVAKRLKSEFPDITVGGPAFAWPGEERVKLFLDTVQRENAPLDFFSWHCYTTDPRLMTDNVPKFRAELDRRGFTKTELHLNEWHYIETPNSEHTRGDMNGHDSAAFTGYVLSRWQDVPLDMGNFYCTWLSSYGLLDESVRLGFFDPNINKRRPYYVFIAFADLLEKTPQRVETEDRENVSLLGGVGNAAVAGQEDNISRKALLVSCYKQSLPALEIELAGVPESGTVNVKRIDSENVCAEEKIDYSGSLLKIANPDGSFVLMITWE